MKVFKFIICTIIGIILFLLLNRYCNGFTVGAPFRISEQWWRDVHGPHIVTAEHPDFDPTRIFDTMLWVGLV